MIKISTKSWHYQMASIVSDYNYPSHSICKYTNQVVCGTLIYSIMIAMCALVIGFNLMGLLALVQGIWEFDATLPFAVVNIITLIISTVVGGAVLASHARRNMKWKPLPISTSESLLWLRLKAFKDKICPHIDEFVD